MDEPTTLAPWQVSPLQNDQLCQAPLQTIPLLLLHIDVQIIHKALSNFLCHKRCPRISLLKLCLSRSELGANLPNLRLYNLSCLMRVCLDWLLQSSKYSNYDLEFQMTSPLSLPDLLHCNLIFLPLNLKPNLLIRDTFVSWCETRRKLNLSPWVSNDLPIHRNPTFPQTVQHSGFRCAKQICSTF